LIAPLNGQQNSNYDPECILDYSHLGQDENSLNRCSGCLTASDEGDKAIALRIYLIRKSDGSGTPFSEEYIDELFNQLNIHYSEPFGIHFLKHCVTFIDDDNIYDFQNPSSFRRAIEDFIGGADYRFYESPDALPFLNLAIHGRISQGGRAAIYGNYAGAGYGIPNEDTGGYYPRAIMHEIGHVLGLFHPHRQNRHNPDFEFVPRNEEFVNGTNCCTTGDYVCDTPADPGICDQRAIFDNCNWSNPDMLTDSNGDVYVNVDAQNIMSYCGRHDCLDTHLTPGQGERLHCTLEDPRAQAIQRPNAIISDQVAIYEDTEFDTDIKIVAGGSLFIVNSTVTMKGGRKIQVEAGGRLVVSGGTITSANDTGCETEGGFWEGIELMNAEDNPNFVDFDRAKVKLSNATISHMERGIFYGSNAVDQPVLGRVSAFYTNFVNNKTAINLVNGFLNNSPRNQVKHNVFVQTDFTVDEGIPGGLNVEGLGDAVRSAYGVPIDFYGCEFSIPEVGSNLAAVNSIVTRISMVNFCTTPGCEDIENPAGAEMKITGYPVGVSLMMADGSRIKNTKFFDTKLAIDAVATGRLNLTRNLFSGEGSLEGKGVVNLTESPDYLIDLNEFINNIADPTDTEPAVALKITKSGIADAFVMNNSFQDFTDAAVYFEGINGNENDELEGAKIYCNAFANKLIPSLGILPSDVFIGDGGNIASSQGSEIKVAGNQFSPSFTHEGSSFKNGTVDLANPLVSYFYSKFQYGDDNDESINSINVTLLERELNTDCLAQRPSVVTGDEEETVIKIVESFEDHTTEMTNVPFGSDCGVCKGKVINDRNDLFLILASWFTAVEGDTNLTDKQTQLAQIEEYRIGNDKTLGSVNRLSRYGDLSNSVNVLSTMVNVSSGGGKGGTESLSYISTSKANESEIITMTGNLFFANEEQKDGFKAVAQASSSAGSEYARLVMDFYYGIDVAVAVQSAGDKNAVIGVPNVPTDLSVKKTLERSIVVYPNPVSNGGINLSGLGEGLSRAELVSAYGEVIVSRLITGDSGNIDVSNLSSGVYYLRLNFTDKPSIIKKVFIK